MAKKTKKDKNPEGLICSELHNHSVWELNEVDSLKILEMMDNPKPAPAEVRERLAAYEERFYGRKCLSIEAANDPCHLPEEAERVIEQNIQQLYAKPLVNFD